MNLTWPGASAAWRRIPGHPPLTHSPPEPAPRHTAGHRRQRRAGPEPRTMAVNRHMLSCGATDMQSRELNVRMPQGPWAPLASGAEEFALRPASRVPVCRYSSGGLPRCLVARRGPWRLRGPCGFAGRQPRASLAPSPSRAFTGLSDGLKGGWRQGQTAGCTQGPAPATRSAQLHPPQRPAKRPQRGPSGAQSLCPWQATGCQVVCCPGG